MRKSSSSKLPVPKERVSEEEFLNMLAADALQAVKNLNMGMKTLGVKRAERRQVMRGIIDAATDKPEGR